MYEMLFDTEHLEKILKILSEIKLAPEITEDFTLICASFYDILKKASNVRLSLKILQWQIILMNSDATRMGFKTNNHSFQTCLNSMQLRADEATHE